MAPLAQWADFFPIPIGVCVLFALLTLTLLIAIARYAVKSHRKPPRHPRVRGFEVIPPKDAPPNDDGAAPQ